jgi:hypothetical protein
LVRLERSAGKVARCVLRGLGEGDLAWLPGALLQSWLEEDTTDDPDGRRQAETELEAFKQAINAERERAGARRIYP